MSYARALQDWAYFPSESFFLLSVGVLDGYAREKWVLMEVAVKKLLMKILVLSILGVGSVTCADQKQEQQMRALAGEIFRFPEGRQFLESIFGTFQRGGARAAKFEILQNYGLCQQNPLLVRYLFLWLAALALPSQKQELLEQAVRFCMRSMERTPEQAKLFETVQESIVQSGNDAELQVWQWITTNVVNRPDALAYWQQIASEYPDFMGGLSPEASGLITWYLRSLAAENAQPNIIQEVLNDIWRRVKNVYYAQGREVARNFVNHLAMTQPYAPFLKQGTLFRQDLDAWITCPKVTVQVLWKKLEAGISQLSSSTLRQACYRAGERLQSLPLSLGHGKAFEAAALADLKENGSQLPAAIIDDLKSIIIAAQDPLAVS